MYIYLVEIKKKVFRILGMNKMRGIHCKGTLHSSPSLTILRILTGQLILFSQCPYLYKLFSENKRQLDKAVYYHTI